MDQLIPIINELQDTYSRFNMPFMDLPQIVIIGSQSAGKSSVLENIVKREFLPRGTGIVTRCPLILHLIHETDPAKGTRGRFLHTGDLDYYDFEKIKEEIAARTNELAGRSKNISDRPITLTIFSADFPDLTLIDLPGLTKVPVQSQPKDIDEQIRSICLQYTQNNSIMLAISAANVDLANSDALQFAERLDPEGRRTLCVITKLDLMDKGTNASDILTGRTHPKKLGYVGVVSRSQQDTIKGRPIAESLLREKEFFQKHYPDLATKNGTDFLTESLNRILKAAIKEFLPDLRYRAEREVEKISSSLEKLDIDKNKATLVSRFLNSFTKKYVEILDGDFIPIPTTICGGALVAEILYGTYPRALDQIDIDRTLSQDIILKAIKNSRGTEKFSFSIDRTYKNLVRMQLEMLAAPTMKCIDDVHDKMRDFVQTASKEFPTSNFPNLSNRIIQVTNSFIKEDFNTTKFLVQNLLASEERDITCSNPNVMIVGAFQNMINKLKNKRDPNGGILNYVWKIFRWFRRGSGDPQNNDQIEEFAEKMLPIDDEGQSVILKNMMVQNFNGVRQNICYNASKLIKTFLVIHVRDNLMNHLLRIFQDPNMDHLLSENESTLKERQKDESLLKDLEIVIKKIDDIHCAC